MSEDAVTAGAMFYRPAATKASANDRPEYLSLVEALVAEATLTETAETAAIRGLEALVTGAGLVFVYLLIVPPPLQAMTVGDALVLAVIIGVSTAFVIYERAVAHAHRDIAAAVLLKGRRLFGEASAASRHADPA
jgi:hypothetical protein